MLAFDPALARFSPGLLCTIAMLESVDVHRVEWLGGTEDYKLQLMDRFEPLHQGVGLARGLGRAYALARLGAVSARVRLKRSDSLRRLYTDGFAFARRR
jgi:CelD/BcsL family acetyltransferase involved in cellulose biosynthesis